MAMRPKLTVCVPYFLPGYRGGGVIRSCGNVVRCLSGEYSINVLTRNRDGGETVPYAVDAQTRTAVALGCAIQYLQPGRSGALAMSNILRSSPPDLLYLNSVFSPAYTLWPLFVVRRTGVPVVIAPRGELLAGARSTKATKKSVFLGLARFARFYGSVYWHATSPEEKTAIEELGLGGRGVFLAPDLPGAVPGPLVPLVKKPGEADFLFLARIHPLKGLERLLRILPGVEGDIRLTIAGPVEDAVYASLCRDLARQLPARILITWIGAVAHDDAMAKYGASHAYILPTLSENHGYTIQEALASGCPVLTSDGTPWKDMETMGAGWTRPLADTAAWTHALNRLVRMGQEEFNALRGAVKRYGMASVVSESSLAATRSLFQAVLVESGRP